MILSYEECDKMCPGYDECPWECPNVYILCDDCSRRCPCCSGDCKKCSEPECANRKFPMSVH